jgi:glycosyltransferase involved in cell wall biosynthesis
MTRIFITIPWFLPAFRAGGPVQSIVNLVNEYDRADFYIFCGDSDLNGIPLEGIRKNEWTPFNDHTKVWYASPKGITGFMFRQLNLINPDLWYIVGVFDWHFNIIPVLGCKGPKKILSARGMLHEQALSQKKWKKKWYLRLLQWIQIQNRISFHATDEEECQFIQRVFGKKAKVFVAGNYPKNVGMLPPAAKKPGNLRISTIALISPMKNILRVLQILDQIEGEIEYHLYGPVKDPGYWKLCLKQIASLPSRIKVLSHGELPPAEIKNALGDTHLFIMPSKSENFGHALYEALSAGRPVITSNNTPWKGLKEAGAGINVDPENTLELKEAISLFVGMDESTLAKWSRNAFDYAKRSIDFEQIKTQYNHMFG